METFIEKIHVQIDFGAEFTSEKSYRPFTKSTLRGFKKFNN